MRGRLRALEGLRAAAGARAEAVAPDGGEPGVSALLADAERLAEAVQGADPELDALAARMRTLRIDAEELGGELRRYESGLEAEPGRLEEAEARLDLYDRLRAQARRQRAAVLAHAEHCRAELALLEDTGAALGWVDAELAEAGAARGLPGQVAQRHPGEGGAAPAKAVLAELDGSGDGGRCVRGQARAAREPLAVG